MKSRIILIFLILSALAENERKKVYMTYDEYIQKFLLKEVLNNPEFSRRVSEEKVSYHLKLQSQ